MKKPTPETDAVAAYEGNWDTKALRMTAHSRKLERERDEAREEIRDWKRLHDAAERGVDLTIAEGTISDLLKQRDEARRELKFLWRERDEARELLASEKITRNHIIKRSVEVERERDEARELHKKSLREREAAERESDATLERAHKAERERDEALMDRARGETATMTINHYERILRERDEARSELSLKQQTLTIAEGTLSDLRKQRDEWSAMCGRYKQEKDTLVQKLDAWQEIADHLHHLVRYPAYGVDQAIRRMDVLEAYKHLKK